MPNPGFNLAALIPRCIKKQNSDPHAVKHIGANGW